MSRLTKLSKSIFLMLLALAACQREQPMAQAPVPKPKPKPTIIQRVLHPKSATAPVAEVTGTNVGEVMPAYSTTWLDGKPFDLAAERGNVVLLNLWATWCGPCRFELPELQAMHDKYSAQRFKVIGVSLDEGGPDVVKEFVQTEKITFPIAHDPEGKLATLLQTTVVPTSLLIDRSGHIVWKQAGAIAANDPELAAALRKAL
jgi:thiol-disulfide isomerase/thioredoxin